MAGEVRRVADGFSRKAGSAGGGWCQAGGGKCEADETGGIRWEPGNVRRTSGGGERDGT